MPQATIAIDNNVSNSTDSLLRLEQVMSITSLCRSHVFLLIKKGKFPASITIGVRGARWSEQEVRQWVATQIANARKAPMPTGSSVVELWPSL
jgi:prophage regulatory protein